ncbi:MAG: hypothetical protein J6V50_02490 [Clostridia bacterium]|nr:hypothetical protein [Clostridia bacterium]
MKSLVRNGICRDCYKELFNIKLRKKDFKCDYYRSPCPVCNVEHHLVAKVKWYIHLKLLFKKNPDIKVEVKCEGFVIGEEKAKF